VKFFLRWKKSARTFAIAGVFRKPPEEFRGGQERSRLFSLGAGDLRVTLGKTTLLQSGI
jgi:hypothetical protein